jgi:A nuclease family of the HNH/ENDO VII superfamily with conserved AHH
MMQTPPERAISVPAQDNRQAALQLAIPTAGVITIAAVGVASIAVYWQATSKDREEVLRIGEQKIKQAGSDLQSQAKAITDEIIKTMQSKVALAGSALNAVRGQIEAALIQILPQPQLDPNNINKTGTAALPSTPSHTGHPKPTENLDPNRINQSGDVPTPAAPTHTGHRSERPAVTDIFSQELFGVRQPDGTIRPVLRSSAQAQSIPDVPGDSAKLGRNMEALRQEYLSNRQLVPEGLKPQKDYAAHHIVEGNDTSIWMQQARVILKRYGIDINAGENGVYLPKDGSVSLRETPHANVHTNEYKQEVLQRLLQAEQKTWNGNPPTPNQQRQNILNELGKIRQELIQHQFPYQKKVELQQDGVEVAQQPINEAELTPSQTKTPYVPTQAEIDAYLAQASADYQAAKQAPNSTPVAAPMHNFSQAEIDAYIAKVNPSNLTLVARTQEWAANWERWQTEVKAGSAYTNMVTGNQTYKLDQMPNVALNNRQTDLGRAALGLMVNKGLLEHRGVSQPDGSLRFEGTQFTYLRDDNSIQILRTNDQSSVFNLDLNSGELQIPGSISDREVATFERNHAILMAQVQEKSQGDNSGWER